MAVVLWGNQNKPGSADQDNLLPKEENSRNIIKLSTLEAPKSHPMTAVYVVHEQERKGMEQTDSNKAMVPRSNIYFYGRLTYLKITSYD